MLKEKIPNTHRETREKPSLSEQVDLALTVLSLLLALILRQLSNNPSAWSSENLFISSHIAQGRPPVFVMTAKRHQEFSTNFSTVDSRIISEKIHRITFVEGFYNNRK